MKSAGNNSSVALSLSQSEAQALLQLLLAARFQRLHSAELHPEDMEAMQRITTTTIDAMTAANVKAAPSLPWSKSA